MHRVGRGYDPRVGTTGSTARDRPRLPPSARLEYTSRRTARSGEGVSPTGEELNGGGLPPSPVTGIVTVPKPGTAITQQVPFCIGCPNPKKSGIEGSRIDPVIKVPRNRLYWYQETNR